MLGLTIKHLNLPVLMIIGGDEGMEGNILEVTLIIDVTPKRIKDPFTLGLENKGSPF